MYLLISDKYALDRERIYYSVSGNWLADIVRCFPNYCTVTSEEIEEILIYSNRSSDDKKRVKTASCSTYSPGQSMLRIDYKSPQEIELSSGDVRKRIYGYCQRNNLLTKSNYSPSIIFVDDLHEYEHIKFGKKQLVVDENLLSRLTDMVTHNNWDGIINCFPKMEQIESDMLWNDPDCLGKLSFALSKQATRTVKNPQHGFKKEYDAFFLKVSERCIELEPFRSMHKSTLAYFLYDRYKKEFRSEDYDRAKELYMDLIKTSQTKFKEEYRYANLLRTRYEFMRSRFNETAYADFNVVIAEYKNLLSDYQNLNDVEKIAQKKNYIKAMYQYVALYADRTFKRYWDVYFNREFAGIPVKKYLIDDNVVSLLLDCESKIDFVLSMIPGKVDADNINDKPSFFDANYRKAQILQSRGFIALFTGKVSKEYLPFFRDSSNIIDNLLKTAEKLRSQRARFNYPNYLKAPQAVNYYILHKTNEIECLFFKAKPWMMYEYGKISILLGSIDHAIDILNTIPEEDLCHAKAKKLIEELNGKK